MKLRNVLLIASITSTLALSFIQAAPASASTNSDFVSSINALRASKGLGTLTVDSRLQSEAQGWAEQMAAKGAISHNPALGSTPGSWSKVGENVGVGGDVPSLMAAFIASAPHYANLVDPSYNSVGVGVATGSDGRIYTTHDFADYSGAASSTTRAATPAATPAAKAPAKTVTTSAPKKTVSTSRPAAVHTAPAPTTTTAVPAPQPVAAAPVAAPAPVLPDPSNQIVQGLVEVGSITTQG